MIKHKKFAKHI